MKKIDINKALNNHDLFHLPSIVKRWNPSNDGNESVFYEKDCLPNVPLVKLLQWMVNNSMKGDLGSGLSWPHPGIQGTTQTSLVYLETLCLWRHQLWCSCGLYLCSFYSFSLLLQALLFSLILAFVQRGHDDSTVLPSPCTFSALHCRCGHKSQPKSQWLPWGLYFWHRFFCLSGLSCCAFSYLLFLIF